MLINRMAVLLDGIALEAADAGEDDSFKAIRAIRAAIVNDLRQRGGVLAAIRTFSPGSPQPSLRLAQRYYRNADRAAQIEVQTDVVHPLFMPVRYQALAT